MPSANFKEKLNAVQGDERPLVLLEIDHSGLTQPIRVVNDYDDVTSNGNVYTGLPFIINLPSQEEDGLPRASLEIDNIGKEMMQWLETSNGGAGATAKVSLILRSNPDTVELGPYDLDLMNVKATQFTVSGQLGYEDILNKPAFQITYRPHNFPGLF